MLRRRLNRLALLAVFSQASLASPTATAETVEAKARALRPYTAQYRTTTRGMDLNLSRSLKQGADRSYTLTNTGKILVAGFHEVSAFQVEGVRVLPKSYVYQSTGLINRRREVHFPADSDTIRSLYKDQWYDLPRTNETLDRMSQHEQLRLLLLNATDPGRDLSLQVADGKRVKDYKLAFIAEETLETPLGPVQTLHFERLHDNPERESDIWLAPAWDYLMVKTVHIEDDSPVEVILTSASIEGVPVSTR